MKPKVNMIIIELINTAWKYVQDEKNSYYNMDLLGKIGISILECKNNLKFHPVNEAELDYIINKIEDKLCSGEILFYYTSFYKVPQVVYRNDPEEFGLLIKKLNIDITSFRIRVAASDIFNFPLNSSEDDYFFSRGADIIRGFKNAINHNKDDIFVPLLYVLLNYYQATKEYINCKDNFQQEYCLKMQKNCIDLFKEIFSISKYLELISKNPQLAFFWNSLTGEYNLKCVNNDEKFFEDSIGDKERWALLSLFKINEELFLKVFQNRYADILNTKYENIQKSILMLQLISRNLFLAKDNDLSNTLIDIPMPKYGDTCPYGPEHFLINYGDITKQVITDKELCILNNYDDQELRRKVSSFITNVDKNELERQASKPHGTLEISDLDVKFTYNRHVYYLSMPFKTAKEITTNSVPENYAYQIFKPFTHFGSHCVVIFITVKKCSQGLETYIQRMINKNPEWKVYIVQEKQLAALLKVNGVLY